MMQYDVTIVGAGLVGSIQSLLLANAGFNVLLIDALPQRNVEYNLDTPPDLRMSLITLRSEEILAELGITDQLAVRCGIACKMHIWDANGPGELNIDSLSIGKNYLGKLIENNFLQQLLNQKINNHHNITQVRPCQIKSITKISNNFELIVDKINNSNNCNQELGRYQSKLIIGADGANSWLRSYLKFDCDLESYQQSALITTVYTKQDTNNTAYQQFLPAGPIAFLPWMRWQDKNIFSIVWSQDSKDVDYWLRCEKNKFIDKLNSLSGNQLQIIDCDNRAAFPLIMRHVNKYSHDGCVLIGDAAHTIHPLAGQGLNLGIYDAYALTQTLIWAKSRDYLLNSNHVLNKYELARRGHNQLILNLMDFFKNIYGSDSRGLSLLRNLGMNIIDNVGVIKKAICRQAAGFY